RTRPARSRTPPTGWATWSRGPTRPAPAPGASPPVRLFRAGSSPRGHVAEKPEGRARSLRMFRRLLSQQGEGVGQDVEDGVEALDGAGRRAGRVQDDAATDGAGDATREAALLRVGQAHGLGQARRLPVEDETGGLGRAV